MKLSILSAFILLGFFSVNTVFAAGDYQNAKDIITKNCNGTSYEGSFLKGYDCTGTKKEIYYIKDAEVTKAYFDIQKSEYELKGDLCTKTEKSKTSELPKGFSYSCTKGAYGTYSLNNKKVSFKEFSNAIMALAFSEMEKENNAKLLTQLNIDKKALKSLKTFTNALLASSDDYTFNMSYIILGSSCIGNGSLLYNGNGYKNLICEKGKVIAMDYYLNNKKVTHDNYIKSIYKTQKDANRKAIATLKKGSK